MANLKTETKKVNWKHNPDNPFTPEHAKAYLLGLLYQYQKTGEFDILKHLIEQAKKDNNVLLSVVKKMIPDKLDKQEIDLNTKQIIIERAVKTIADTESETNND
jgi:hypothetical protein